MRTSATIALMLFLSFIPFIAIAHAEGKPSVIFLEAPGQDADNIDVEVLPDFRRETLAWGRRYLPRSEIAFVSLYYDKVWTHRQNVRHYTRGWQWIEEDEISFGRAGVAVNALGEVDWVRFNLAKNIPLACFGWLQYFGDATGWDNDKGIPPNYLGGYYCDRQPKSETFIVSVLQSIHIRGYRTH